MKKAIHTRLSTYVAFAAWGTFAFMAHPTLASFACFVIATLLFVIALWLARYGH